MATKHHNSKSDIEKLAGTLTHLHPYLKPAVSRQLDFCVASFGKAVTRQDELFKLSKDHFSFRVFAPMSRPSEDKRL